MSRGYTDGTSVAGHEEIESTALSDVEALHLLEKYLASPLFPGIGSRRAAAIVTKFGHGAIAVIETNPEELTKAKGIGSRLKAAVVKGWATQPEIKAVCRIYNINKEGQQNGQNKV